MISPRVEGLLETLMRASSRTTGWSSERSETFRTSTTLYICLTTCSTAVFDPSTTIVRRIMSGTSVWPIVSDSIAKPRERNRLMTRLNVNGLLSIVATSVCFKRDHLRKRRPRDDHREHIFTGVDHEFDERRTLDGR